MKFEHGGHYKKNTFSEHEWFSVVSHCGSGYSTSKIRFLQPAHEKHTIFGLAHVSLPFEPVRFFYKLMHNHSKHVFVSQHAREFVMMISIRKDRPR